MTVHRVAGYSAGAMLAVALWLGSGTALADPSAVEVTPEALYLEGTTALADGRYQDAIDSFESYADRAKAHPDASFNRGLAYIMRVENGAGKPGDLGRAAAAFEETVLLRDSDEEANVALGRVQGEVARRRSRDGRDSLLAKPTLDRVVVGLARERTWGILAIVSGWLLAAGLLLRRRDPGSLQLAGTLIIPASVVVLLVVAPLYWRSRDLRLNTESAVVVVREAYLGDETGKPLSGATIEGADGGDANAIPEAARVEVGERKGRFVNVRYGSKSGWIPLSSIQLLRSR